MLYRSDNGVPVLSKGPEIGDHWVWYLEVWVAGWLEEGCDGCLGNDLTLGSGGEGCMGQLCSGVK